MNHITSRYLSKTIAIFFLFFTIAFEPSSHRQNGRFATKNEPARWGFHGCSVLRGVHQYTHCCLQTAQQQHHVHKLHQCLVSANVYFQDEPVQSEQDYVWSAQAETTRTQRRLETSGVTKTNKNKPTHHSGRIVP